MIIIIENDLASIIKYNQNHLKTKKENKKNKNQNIYVNNYKLFSKIKHYLALTNKKRQIKLHLY